MQTIFASQHSSSKYSTSSRGSGASDVREQASSKVPNSLSKPERQTSSSQQNKPRQNSTEETKSRPSRQNESGDNSRVSEAHDFDMDFEGRTLGAAHKHAAKRVALSLEAEPDCRGCHKKAKHISADSRFAEQARRLAQAHSFDRRNKSRSDSLGRLLTA